MVYLLEEVELIGEEVTENSDSNVVLPKYLFVIFAEVDNDIPGMLVIVTLVGKKLVAVLCSVEETDVGRKMLVVFD